MTGVQTCALPISAGCAAGLKTLEIYERDDILGKAQHLSELAAERMQGWAEKYAIVSEVRQLGLLIGISFCNPALQVKENPLANIYMARSVRNELLRNGVWAICEMEANIRMYPALNMEAQQLLQGLEITEAAIASIEESGNTVGDYPALPSGVVGF